MKLVIAGLSLRFQVAGRIQQVGGEINREGFLLVLFLFYFPMTVAGGNPRPPPLNDSPVTGKCIFPLLRGEERCSFRDLRATVRKNGAKS